MGIKSFHSSGHLRLSEQGQQVVRNSMKLKFPSMSMSSLAKELQFSRYTIEAFLQGRPLPRKDFVNLCQSIGIKDWKSVAERDRSINIGQAVAGLVIAAGNNNLVISENGEVVEVVEVVDHDVKVTSQDQAVEKINCKAHSDFIQMNENMNKARKESGLFFTITLVSASLGFVVFLAGVGLLLAGQVDAGKVSSILSIIPEIVAGLFFGKDKELRDTIERYHQSISDLQRILTMIDIAETIKSEGERDFLKKQIIYKALDIDSRGG